MGLKRIGWICLLLSVFLLACQPQSEPNSQTGNSKEKFFSDLDVNKIQQITVSQQGAEPLVSLMLEGGRWQMLYPSKLPANPELMIALLDSLKNAKILEQETAKTKWYKHLGVDDISVPQARGTLLVLHAGDVNTELIVGDKSRNQQGQYWRATNSPDQAVMRVDQRLDLPREAIGWMDRQIIDLPANGVASVKIVSSDGNEFFLHRSSHEQDLVLESDTSDESQLPYSVNQLVFGLTRLNFDAVEATIKIPTDAAPYILTFGLFDNSAIRLSLFPDEGGSWASLVAINDPQASNTTLVTTMNKQLSARRYHLSAQRTALYIQAIKALAGESGE